jgi:hypothetical protein
MDELWQFWNELSDKMLVGGTALAVVLALLLFVVMFLLFRRRGARADLAEPDLRIDLTFLPDHGPPSDGPRLEYYGTPVRLVVLVLAPAGRHSPIPAAEELPELIDSLVPGLWAVVEAHRPVVRCWPFQLSTQGFAHAFFKHVQLPGDRGKGTPWSAVSGRFETGTRQLLAGIVCVADRPNSLSQITVAHVGQWLDVLRVRNQGEAT